MRTIDILTTQNVTINYELAEVRDRLFAYVIDLLILVVGLVILTKVIMATGIFANEDYTL